MQERRIANHPVCSVVLRTLVVFVAVGVLGACTDRPETDETVADTAGVMSDTNDFESEAQASEGATVDVTLTDFDIEMDSTLEAGRTVFSVSNDGDEEHNFEVEGQGMEREFESNLQPGDTEELEVDLQPGSYVIYCPVEDHRSQGMEVQLTVSERATPTPAY